MQDGIRLLQVFLVTILFIHVISAKDLRVPEKYPSIQAAIDVAKDGDEVIVSRGTYRENIDFKGKSITVRSIDPDKQSVVSSTVIDGGRRAPVATFKNGETKDAVLTGLTLTANAGTKIIRGEGADAVWTGLTISKEIGPAELSSVREGGGVYIENSSPTVKDNIIKYNTAQDFGGGVYIIGSSSAAIISGNIISDNWCGEYGGGICIAKNASPTINGNIISGNTAILGSGIFSCSKVPEQMHMATPPDSKKYPPAKIIDNAIIYNFGDYGGGIYLWNCSPVITKNKVMSNKTKYDGAGIYIRHSSPEISGNIVSDNIAKGFWGGGGFVLWARSSPMIIGNTISGNISRGEGSVWGGGGLCIWNKCNPTIKDNTISGNYAKASGGAISLHANAKAIIANNIIDGNKTLDKGGAIYVFYDSDVIDESGKAWIKNQKPSPNSNRFTNNIPDDLYFEIKVYKGEDE